MARQTLNDCFFNEGIIEDQIFFFLPDGRKLYLHVTNLKGTATKIVLGLQSGKKRPAERVAAVITAKFTVKRFFWVINPFLFPVGCVEKGFKAQFKSAMIVVEKK